MSTPLTASVMFSRPKVVKQCHGVVIPIGLQDAARRKMSEVFKFYGFYESASMRLKCTTTDI